MCKTNDLEQFRPALTELELERIIRSLANLPPEQRAREALIVSAKLVEFAAFESATWLPSGNVGELIDWAAQLDRRSNGTRKGRAVPDLGGVH